MTDIERQNLESEKNGLKMDLIFNNQYGAGIVADYVAQKEAGETPTIDINVINASRKAISTRIKQIEDTFNGLNVEIKLNLINCSYQGKTGEYNVSKVKADLTLENAKMESIDGEKMIVLISLDDVVLEKDVDYTFSQATIQATTAGLNKVKNQNARILKISITGE